MVMLMPGQESQGQRQIAVQGPKAKEGLVRMVQGHPMETAHHVKTAQGLPMETARHAKTAQGPPMETARHVKTAQGLPMETARHVKTAQGLPMETARHVKTAHAPPMETAHLAKMAQGLPMETAHHVKMDSAAQAAQDQEWQVAVAEALHPVAHQGPAHPVAAQQVAGPTPKRASPPRMIESPSGGAAPKHAPHKEIKTNAARKAAKTKAVAAAQTVGQNQPRLKKSCQKCL